MPSNKIYTIDWFRLVTWIIPPVLRRPRLLALCNSLVSAINDLYTRFIYYRANTLYRIGITSQVCHLERALNDRYDVIERRIFITDGISVSGVPLFLKSESKPVKLFLKSEAQELVLYTKAETAQFSVDFVVNVPVAVDFDPAELTAFVNSYKLASKTFKIKTV